MMNKRLGLGIAGDFFQEELVKEEDFMMKQEPSMPHQSQVRTLTIKFLFLLTASFH